MSKKEVSFDENHNYPREKKWILSDFDIGNFLGRGKFGRVYIAKEKRSKFVVAMKILSKKYIIENDVELQVKREIEIQTHLSHPNILKMYGYFHDDRKVYLILEYAPGGNLKTRMIAQSNKRFNETIVIAYISQLVCALKYCHNKKVIHREIILENLLLGVEGELKIADFGWSVHTRASRKTLCGTADYLAPEMIKGLPYDHTIDIWSLGIICYELLVGYSPFFAYSYAETYSKIINLQYTFPEFVSQQAQDLIKKLLVLDSNLRLPLDGVLIHPWINRRDDKF